MDRVFIVTHSHEFDDGHEDVKMIGAFSAREKAEAVVSRLRTEPGFRDQPEGFHVEPYELDVDHWSEGFVTVE